MKNVTKLSLALLTTVVLSACGGGGGGGGGGGAPIGNSTEQTSNLPSINPSSVNTSSAPQVSETGTGAAYVISDMDSAATTDYKTLNDSSNLNFIVIDGKQIRVSHQDLGIKSGSWTKINDLFSCCGKYSDVRFGALESEHVNNKDIIFYNGNVSKSVPTSGTAAYVGDFIATADRVTDENYVRGAASFSADFGAKTLTGTLSQSGALKSISINAAIDGNSFKGDAASADFATKATVNGKFFGENAKELGGVFSDAVGKWAGAFGAAKQ